MDVLLFIIMFILGLVGSFFSGLLGIGGAIINYPCCCTFPLLWVLTLLLHMRFPPLACSRYSFPRWQV